MRVSLFALLFTCARAQSTAPIPDPIAFFEEVKAHQHEMDAIRENYTFHRIRRTDELDSKGVVKKTTTEEREVFFVNGYQIGRLVKRDGVELSEHEEKNEQARVQKMVEMRMKAPPPPVNRRGRLGMISEILAVATISNPRRLSLNDRDTIAFDFTGDRKAHAQDTGQNAAKKMSGSLWFDASDRQVARLEVRFDDNFRIGGGLLASIRKGTYLTVEQSPVGDGLWMQTSSEQHLDARIVVKSFRENLQVKNFDFKKFQVETVIVK